MSNLETYRSTFVELLGVPESELESLTYQSIPAWDSVGHMALMAALEVAFKIELDMPDILDFSSYLRGKEIIAKYGVDLES